MEASIRNLTRRHPGSDDDDSDNGASSSKKKAKKSGPSALELELAKYRKKTPGELTKDGKKKKRDEGDILAALDRFRGKIKGAEVVATEEAMDVDVGAKAPEVGEGGDEEGREVDDDTEWLSHRLMFPKGNEEEVAKAEHDYEVIDPRARGAAAKEEEAKRKEKRGKTSVGKALQRAGGRR